ncbi:hypothetical protein ACFSUS_26440 [Spirosoma soli]|uniref:Copper resistance protein NlpE n=1 Tax=Spirosoma soli TaxID=1770529 RepID=A0ABW5MCT5_9BACT
MATRNAVQSLLNLLIALLVVGSLTTACKKSGGPDSDIDPRDQYVGVYDGSYTSTTYINNSLPASDPEPGIVQITVTKAQTAKQMYLELLFNNTTKQNLTAELTDSTFIVIDKKSEPLAFGGKTYDAQYTAQGQFVRKDNKITLNTTAETLQLGVTLTKRGDITGTKK